MRIEPKAGRKNSETNQEAGNPGSPPAAERDGELIQALLKCASGDYQDQARASWLAAQAATPLEIRSERIAAIQRAIANGTYQVSAEQTAEAILSERQIRSGTAA